MNKREAKEILGIEMKLYKLRGSLNTVLFKATREANRGDYIQTGILLDEALSYLKTIKGLPITPMCDMRYEAPITKDTLQIEERY